MELNDGDVRDVQTRTNPEGHRNDGQVYASASRLFGWIEDKTPPLVAKDFVSKTTTCVDPVKKNALMGP